jgi:hypothetical protein
MNTDGVTTAFELIIDEIEAVAQQIADLGSDAFKNKDHEKARILAESGENLVTFRERVSALLTDWQAGIDIDTRKRFPRNTKITKRKRNSTKPKANKTILKVTLPNGKVIEDQVAANTFADTIKALDVNKVRKLDLKCNGIPLIDSVKHNKYSQIQINELYLITSSSTKYKKEVLENIAEQLGVQISIEIKEP